MQDLPPEPRSWRLTWLAVASVAVLAAGIAVAASARDDAADDAVYVIADVRSCLDARGRTMTHHDAGTRMAFPALLVTGGTPHGTFMAFAPTVSDAKRAQTPDSETMARRGNVLFPELVEGAAIRDPPSPLAFRLRKPSGSDFGYTGWRNAPRSSADSGVHHPGWSDLTPTEYRREAGAARTAVLAHRLGNSSLASVIISSATAVAIPLFVRAALLVAGTVMTIAGLAVRFGYLRGPLSLYFDRHYPTWFRNLSLSVLPFGLMFVAWFVGAEAAVRDRALGAFVCLNVGLALAVVGGLSSCGRPAS